MVADTAMLRGPAELGDPARPTIKNIAGKKKNVNFLLVFHSFALLLGLS